MVLPQGVMLPQGQYMAMPPTVLQPVRTNAFTPVVQPKQGMMVLPANYAPTNVPGQQPIRVIVQNPQQQPNSQQMLDMDNAQQASAYAAELQRKKQMEEDEALARKLQEEENRYAF
jgi:hypothetical protein